jgi:hypothetical protein
MKVGSDHIKSFKHCIPVMERSSFLANKYISAQYAVRAIATTNRRKAFTPVKPVILILLIHRTAQYNTKQHLPAKQPYTKENCMKDPETNLLRYMVSRCKKQIHQL